MKKSLRHSSLKKPPTLPAQADPQSDEARLFGPLSKRREVNIHWRFFTEETKKLYPPLEISVVNSLKRADGSVTAAVDPDQNQTIQKLGLVGGGFQDLGISRALESMSVTQNRPPQTRRERKALQNHPVISSQNDNHNITPILPTRYLRRSHQQLLGKIPLLTYMRKTSEQDRESQKGSYEVSVPQQAASIRLYRTPTRLALVDEKNMAWIRRAREVEKQKKSAKEQ